jgi:hypothetical protein
MWNSGKFLSKFALETGFYWFKNPYVKNILPLITPKDTEAWK